MRVLIQRARDGDTLALPAAKICAELAKHGVNSILHRAYELIGVGETKRFYDALLVKFRAVAYVLRDRVVENIDALAYEADIFAQARDAKLADLVVAVE